MPEGDPSLVERFAQHAVNRPGAPAFVFAPGPGASHIGITFAELHQRTSAVAARLEQHTARGDRALLVFPAGLDFVVAFCGCLVAGVIAVPLMPPRRAADRDSSAGVIADCSPKVLMTSRQLLVGRPDIEDRLRNEAVGLMTVDAMEDATAEGSLPRRLIDPADIALLQYTSGSTSTPKGVVVTHGNLVSNLEMIRLAMGTTESSTSVGWVPVYHDMGLMMGVIQPLYHGALSVMMAPAAFMQRPLHWLHLIHHYRAEVTSAPNFAFDLCVSRFHADQMEGIDLSSWKVALNGAEPVHANTIARFVGTFAPYGFNAGTMFPGYGLAEATLLVAGNGLGRKPVRRDVSRSALLRGEIAEPASDDDLQSLVSCGRGLVGQDLAIVDPENRERLPSLRVGEIWVIGPNVTHGYWRNPAATSETFRAQIARAADRYWLRTGDLGFVDANGELFITGRIKDLIIIRGMNHYPQDIERTVQESHPALRRNWGAAFAIVDEDGNEKLVVVQEVERTQRKQLDLDDVIRSIRAAVTRQHDIAVHEIVLITPASLPKTTSGKVQRSLTKRLWLSGQFAAIEP